jgi:hypothetical protein
MTALLDDLKPYPSNFESVILVRIALYIRRVVAPFFSIVLFPRITFR